jgi:hypothetical protein
LIRGGSGSRQENAAKGLLRRHARTRVFLAKQGIARYQVARVFRPLRLSRVR